MAARDPKSGIVDGRRRAITIHDGTRITPTLVRILSTISDEADDLTINDVAAVETTNRYQRRSAREDAEERYRPIIVARADGLAVYVRDRGVL